ncbi:hypothetical protein [Bacillus marinisedimentorum]|nr:hypothetical protein [Bacillus marinisedimentorum]
MRLFAYGVKSRGYGAKEQSSGVKYEETVIVFFKMRQIRQDTGHKWLG